MMASTFSPSPNRKPEPRVLTMEPEPRTRKMVIRALVLVAIAGLVFVSPWIWQSEQLAGFRDRFDHWYEADAPSGAMAGAGTEASTSPSAAPSSTEPGSRPASDARGTRAASPTRAVSPPRSAPARAPAKTIAPPARRPAPPPEPTPEPAPAPVTPGRLLVSATPWGILYVDGRPMGTTPVRDLQVAPGTHVVRITHEGYEPFEGSIQVTAGQEVRLTGIVLREAKR
jgi:hypothetical protein